MDTDTEKKKYTWNQIAFRILIWFFAGMICCSVIARSADSLTVAKITKEHPKRDRLNFKVDGTGTVIGRAEKEADLFLDIRIDAIYVKLGDKVKEGDDLFSYHYSDLMSVYEEKKDALRKAEIEYEKAMLNASGSGDSYDETSLKLALTRAQEDLDGAKEKAIKAQENLQSEEQKALNAFDEEQSKIYKERMDELEAVMKTLNEANEKLGKKKTSLAEEVRAQQRVIEDLEQKLAGLETGTDDITELLYAFESSIINYSSEENQKIKEDIITRFYGSLDARKEADRQIADAKKEYSRAVSDCANTEERLRLIMEEEKEKVDQASGENYFAALRAYELQVLARDAAWHAANRTVDDASDAVERLAKGRNELELLLESFVSAVYNKNQAERYHAEKSIRELIADQNTQAAEEKEQEKAEKEKEKQDLNRSLLRANEDLEIAKQKWQDGVNEAEKAVLESEEAVEKAEKRLNEIEMDLDMETALSAAKSNLEQAEKDVVLKERALKDSELTLAQMRSQKYDSDKNEDLQEAVNELNLESLKMDIDNQIKNLKKWDEIINNKGVVKAAEAGSISKVTIQEGKKAHEEEKLCLSIDLPGFEAEISGEDAENVAIGDMVTVDGGSRLGKQKAQVTAVIPSKDGVSYLLTADLLDQKLIVGKQLSFEFIVQSGYYDMIIPISAIRENNEGTYVLVLSEQSTVLGTEMIARKVAVELISQDSKSAAVSGALRSQDAVITGSNKAVAEGDRVRVYE